jgi:hypothetical protein
MNGLTLNGVMIEFDEPGEGFAYVIPRLTDKEQAELVRAGFEIVRVNDVRRRG